MRWCCRGRAKRENEQLTEESAEKEEIKRQRRTVRKCQNVSSHNVRSHFSDTEDGNIEKLQV